MNRVLRVKRRTVFLLFLFFLFCVSCKSFKSFSKSNYGKQVIDNIKRQDSDAMYSMFASIYQESDAFKADLDKFLDAIYALDLDFEKADKKDGRYSKNYDNGNLSYYDCTIIYDEVIDASERKYSLVISLTQTDTEHPENVGLQCLGLMLYDETDSSRNVTYIGRDNSSDSLYCYDVLNLES